MIGRGLSLALGAALIFLVLVSPNTPDAMQWSAMRSFPLELPLLLFGVAALGSRRVLPAVLAVLLLSTVALKIADYAMFVAYDRPFNPILDTFLVGAGMDLLRDSVGTGAAAVILATTALVMAWLLVGLFYALRSWSSLRLTGKPRIAAGAIAVVFAAITIVDAGHSLKYWTLNTSPPGTSRTTWLSVKRATEMRTTAADLAGFKIRAAEDPYARRAGLFDLIGSRDVLIIFIESYGRTSFENPLYAGHLDVLRSGQTDLANAGFDMRSGWLTSPTAGGQSWLAHGTLSSGLWTDNHGRYSAMLTSGRRSLFHLAQQSGFRTNAIMPAITIAWPESRLMGFDQIIAAADLPYKGAPFNWVTMPDQFTLSAYQKLLQQDQRPDFTQIALITSHAPWVPIPPVLPWSEVGDGQVFAQWADKGPTPREVWKDRDKVRAQYALAIDYVLQVSLQHIASLGPEAPLILLLGDHQPAGFVAQIDSKDVPMHVIGPAEVIARIDGWGWTPGLIPAPDAPVWRMDAFRDRLIEAFTSQRLAQK